jgi:hypothetical protein
MIRKVTGVVGGLIVWFIVATIGNLLFRISWPGYAGVEIAMTFTPAMMIARLLLGALSSLCAGCAVAWITKASSGAARILGALLIVLFIPVHYGLWDKFPVWYHLIFLASLFPFTLLGSYFSRRFLAVQQ